MKKSIKSVVWIFVGLIIGFPLFSLSYYTMVRTSTPQFCATCHEIRFAYNTWKTSTHVNNAQGFVADCMDCHLPAPHDTFEFFYAKTFHGIKDIAVHFTPNGQIDGIYRNGVRLADSGSLIPYLKYGRQWFHATPVQHKPHVSPDGFSATARLKAARPWKRPNSTKKAAIRFWRTNRV